MLAMKPGRLLCRRGCRKRRLTDMGALPQRP